MRSRTHAGRGALGLPTPAQRVIELQQQIAALERDLAEANAKADRAEAYHQRYTRIGGVSFGGIAAAQSWAEFVLWESLLNDKRFEAVIELGTWQGGFAWWMWAQAQARKMAFFTFDALRPEREMPSWPDEHFHKADIFIEAPWVTEAIQHLEPLILFCDNGNKPRELKTFGTALQHPDSLVVVHDWGTEVQPEDVPDELEMVYRDFCEELGSMSRVFKRRQNG